MKKNAKGVDVSEFQSAINWAQMKASGIEFVMIRAGYGKSNTDKKFKTHIEGALNAGLKVGVYWFLYALDEAHAKANATKCASVIEKYKDKITLGVWCDVEGDTDVYYTKNTGKNLDKATRTRFVEIFLEELKARGYTVGYYANYDYYKNKLGNLLKYPFWFAYYAEAMANVPATIWQYSSKGGVEGYAKDIDKNIFIEDFLESPEKAQEVEEPKKETPKESTKYTVKKGETLSEIAKDFKTTVQALAELNNIKNPDKILAGQTLVISAGASTTKKVRVSTPKNLNIRAEATTFSKKVGLLSFNEVVEITTEKAGWGKLADNRGWICLAFTKRL